MVSSLGQWLQTQPRGTLAKIARRTGLTPPTIDRLKKKGARVHKQTAELICQVVGELGGSLTLGDFELVPVGKERDRDVSDDDESRHVA